MFKQKIKIALFFFTSLKLFSQIDSGLTYKSYAYVSAQKGGNIQIIDNITKTFSGSIGIISSDLNWRNAERTLGISKDGQFLFQDSYGLSTTTQIIDVSTNTIVSGINLSDKSGMVCSPDGNIIYTAKAYSVLKYNLIDKSITTLASRNTGTCNPTNPNEAYQSVRIALSSNGQFLYVGNLDPRKKGISVYDTSNGSEIKINSGISGANRLNISPDDAYVYVCNNSWGYAECTGDPNLMIDIYGNTTNHSNDIAIINTATNTVSDYLNVGGPKDVVVNNDGSKIYVGTADGVKVIERNLSTNIHTLGNILYATGAVSHMGIDPNGDYLYVVSSDILKLISLSDGTITTISTTSETNKSLGNIVFSSYYTPPTNLQVATNPTNNNSVLNWSAVSSPNLVNYKIYGGTSTSNLQLIGTVNAGTETFTHSNLLEEKTYYYRISATDNQNNETIKTSTVTTTTTKLQPVITGPNGATGSTSSISLAENKTNVYNFSADKSVLWSLGNSNDEALFSINSSGNLVFNLAPDFETPLSGSNNNTYLAEVIATDTSNNISSQIVTVTITDVSVAPFSTFNPIGRTYFDRTFSIASPPTSNNSNPVTYISSNSAVATVSGSTITITGIGTTTITAIQASDANFDSNSISTTLTINGIKILTKNGVFSETDLNYIDKNGKIGGELSISKNGETKIIRTP